SARSDPRATAEDSSCERHRLFAVGDAASEGRKGARQSRGGWPGHAAAPGATGFCRLVRHRAGGDAGTAPVRTGITGLNTPMAKRGMLVLGLTGSIGMGKSTGAQQLRRLGVPVHDADAEVHRLLRQDRPVITEIGAAFPGVVKSGVIDRTELGRRVFGNEVALQRLEAIVHPRVQLMATRFLRRSARDRRPLVALDIPLLFETGGEHRCDAVVVVTAPDFVQKGRVLQRPGMTAQRLAAILARQTPDAVKQRLADFVVSTGLDRRQGLQTLARAVTLARRRRWRRRQARRRRDLA